MDFYKKAVELGTLRPKRVKANSDWHPRSLQLFQFLKDIDYNEYGDYFKWKHGGEGDNGNVLMDQLDSFFETVDILEDKKS